MDHRARADGREAFGEEAPAQAPEAIEIPAAPALSEDEGA